jgi:hypothetical protein
LPSIPVVFALARELGVEAMDLVGFDLRQPRAQLLDAARRFSMPRAATIARRSARRSTVSAWPEVFATSSSRRGSELGGHRTIVGLLVTNTGSAMGSITPMLEDTCRDEESFSVTPPDVHSAHGLVFFSTRNDLAPAPDKRTSASACPP